ncbi:MAG: hypothetical protein ACO1OB_17950 [Archangium sp.]
MRHLSLLLLLAFTACGPRTMQVRLKDAERLAAHADELLNEAQVAADAAQPEKLERALDAAKRDLNDKDFSLVSGAHEYLDRYNELSGRIPTVKEDRERRDLVARVDAARTLVTPKVQAFNEAAAALSPSAPTTPAITTLELKAKELTDALGPQVGLINSTPDGAQWLKTQQEALTQAADAAARGKKGVAFLEGPVAAWRDALALQADAKRKPTPAEKEQPLLSAKEKLTSCATAAKSFADDKTIASLAFTVPEGKPLTPTQLSSTCTRALKPVETELKAVQKKLKKK